MLEKEWTLTARGSTSNMDATLACIAVVPFGTLPKIALESISTHLKRHLNLRSEILAPIEMPSSAFDEKRLQYNAALVIEALEEKGFRKYMKVIGVANVDLFIPIFTHVFGEAREGGRCALVSMYRLRRNLDTSNPPLPQILNRTVKVALHELGHLYNVVHCANRNCLMHFAGTLEELDLQPISFCQYCEAYLLDAIKRYRLQP